MSTPTTDLAIIGAGVSGTHTLLALLKSLVAAPCEPPVRIVVIDRDAQYFAGVAYGNRSGATSLTLSTLHGFLPDEERARFIEWLGSHRDAVHGEDVDPAWTDRHLADIVSGQWNELHIPRRLYGRYLKDCATAAISDAQATGAAEITCLTGDVTSVDRVSGRFLLTASHGGGVSQLDAAVAVLAVGSPPTHRLRADDAPTDDAPTDGLVRDIYDPGLDATLRKLRSRLLDLPREGREVLVVGGNAAALEFVTASSGVVRELRARVTVLTPSGRPRHWRRGRDGEVAELVAMAALRAKADGGARVTAQELHEAVAADLDATTSAGTDVAAVREIVASIPHFLPLLDTEERASLAGRHGIPITNLLRQDCSEAVAILESSVATGAVVFRIGRYREARIDGQYFRVTATDEHGRAGIHETRYGVVVGATGFEALSTCQSTLLQYMLRTGLVDPSGSDTGLRVDNRFQAAPRLFVVGPMLAGNAHPNMLIWHAESVRRILSIAPEAASFIAGELSLLTPKSPLSSSLHD